MLDTIYARGLKGYSNDSAYSEFVFDRSDKNVKLMGLRKGVVSGSDNTVTWNTSSAIVKYGEGSGDIVYSYNGILTEVILNDNYFAENVTTYEYGRLQAKVDYHYNSAGHLSWARVERPGQTPVMVYYRYPDLQNPEGAAEIVIEESPGEVYHIPLATVDDNGVQTKQENAAYVCNVLRYGRSPITNEYVINADLYYIGLYGQPFKYLPDETIEKSVRQAEVTIVRVGSGRYYY
ncbi:MAG: hypothetical protein LBF85_09125 [Tannerella sp.]|jgi:hypothetical protein|nr:hypothetical protein [Tannerella sp.]